VDQAREKEVAKALAWRIVCSAVDMRDGKQCRCCDKRSDPNATGLLKRGHRHHLIYRSAGGEDSMQNLVTLCSQCHSDEHHNKLRIEGNPNVALTFWRKDALAIWYVVRQEVSVRVVLKD
jgi:5-methylcytosine-specific restriction endonuclease McrA